MNKTTKESLYYQVNKMIDLLTDRDVQISRVNVRRSQKRNSRWHL